MDWLEMKRVTISTHKLNSSDQNVINLTLQNSVILVNLFYLKVPALFPHLTISFGTI